MTKFRVGHGFDAHRLVAGRALILGGVTVPNDRGPLGHSDGDVVTHALCDALLGSCALGDLGAHFPSDDARWKDADSLQLLGQCAQFVERAGYRIENVDATVVLQAPKLAPYLNAMRERFAAVLSLPIEAVSVKAKTSEGMGYTGDGTGIAAYAVAFISH